MRKKITPVSSAIKREDTMEGTSRSKESSLQKLNDQLLLAKESNNKKLIGIIMKVINKIKIS
jgi:hypothetical protein